MSTADLGYPILLFIMCFWTILAVVGIIMGLVEQGKISGKKIREKFHSQHHHFLEQ
jgi:hypothetical protein